MENYFFYTWQTHRKDGKTAYYMSKRIEDSNKAAWEFTKRCLKATTDFARLYYIKGETGAVIKEYCK